MTSQQGYDDAVRVNLDDEGEVPNDIKILAPPKFLPQRILQGIGAAIILGLAIFITVSVILRYMGSGILGSVEIASLGMVLITVLVIPAATAADENFRVEVADFFVGEKALSWLNVLGVIVQVVVALFLAAAAIDLLWHDLSTGTTMGGELSMPRWWVSLPITAGFVGLVYSTFLTAARIRRSPAANTALPED